jgi:hypothetical protein
LGAARGSLDGLADALVERARPALRGADVAIAVSAPWPKLAGDLAALLSARVRAAGARSASRDAAGCNRRLAIELSQDGPRLHAVGTLSSLPSALWGGEPEALAHLFVDATIDDELRAYLPRAGAPVGWQARQVALGDIEPLAMAAGDTDGDGRAEVVLLTAREVIALRADGDRASERWRVPLSGKPAVLRPRAEIGAVTVENGAVIAHASGFADGIRRARTVELARGFAMPGVGVCELQAGVDWFSCAGLPERVWSAAGLFRRGANRPTLAAVEPGAVGTLWLREPDGVPFELRGVGAQVALLSLERGDFVAVSEPVQPGEPDAVVVHALTPGLPVAHRLDRLGGNVRALAAGDLDGDGAAELIAAVRDDAARRTSLWILR